MNTITILSILGIIALIVGALFLTGFIQRNLFVLPLAYAQYYNSTTGNYGDDPNNPNNADNIIIKYCLENANLVAAGQNVVQDLVISGMVPSYYDGKSCQQVNQEHTMIIQEYDWNKRLKESNKRFSEALTSDDPKDELTKEMFNDLPKDAQEEILGNK
jgi:hypothetical protein